MTAPISIGELEAIFATPHALIREEMIAIKDAAPALIAIAKAALAFQEQRARNVLDAITRSEAEVEAESAEVARSRRMLTLKLSRPLDASLKAVRP